MYLKVIVKFTLSLHVAQFKRLTWPAQKSHAGPRRRLCGKQWHFSSYSSVWHRWPGKKGWVYARRQLSEETEHIEISTSLQIMLLKTTPQWGQYYINTKHFQKAKLPEVTWFKNVFPALKSFRWCLHLPWINGERFRLKVNCKKESH